MKNVLVLIMIVEVVFGATAQKDNSKLKKIGGNKEECLSSLSSLSSLSELSDLSDLSSLAVLSQLSDLSELSSLSSLSSVADQDGMVIVAPLAMDVTEDLEAMLEDLENLHDIRIDLSGLNGFNLPDLNKIIIRTVNKVKRVKEQ